MAHQHIIGHMQHLLPSWMSWAATHFHRNSMGHVHYDINGRLQHLGGHEVDDSVHMQMWSNHLRRLIVH